MCVRKTNRGRCDPPRIPRAKWWPHRIRTPGERVDRGRRLARRADNPGGGMPHATRPRHAIPRSPGAMRYARHFLIIFIPSPPSHALQPWNVSAGGPIAPFALTSRRKFPRIEKDRPRTWSEGGVCGEGTCLPVIPREFGKGGNADGRRSALLYLF